MDSIIRFKFGLIYFKSGFVSDPTSDQLKPDSNPNDKLRKNEWCTIASVDSAKFCSSSKNEELSFTVTYALAVAECSKLALWDLELKKKGQPSFG